jgi:hypothetical protein
MAARETQLHSLSDQRECEHNGIRKQGELKQWKPAPEDWWRRTEMESPRYDNLLRMRIRVLQYWKLRSLRRMPTSGMLHPVAFVGTDVSEERSASIIRVRIGELGTLA